MLKISELRQRKQDLETNVAQLIHDFESETGVKIDGLISVLHLNKEDMNEKINSIKVEIHLDV
ncbi:MULTISPECIES: hypothetical protein [Vitreoscilla]|uniref:Uncharacterized protein n=1 Tax=Vitreoscilla stercoraria TaxID=61 RepID=A0ABY4EBT0_VITST|nr:MULTISPECIES: hypothetical protein [Vitreoscilla]AUZ05820.1 hypothetical protein ADP71_24900 [Vitreoscilla sp. C1]UOO92803.1 hypothetical protein LVJ81_01785 [Vitreoscilla stercoraria]